MVARLRCSASGCDEPTEDCTGGTINTCNPGCSNLILPLWEACQAQLGPAAQVLAGVIDLCRAGTPSGGGPGSGGPAGGGGAHAVHQYAMARGWARPFPILPQSFIRG